MDTSELKGLSVQTVKLWKSYNDRTLVTKLNGGVQVTLLQID